MTISTCMFILWTCSLGYKQKYFRLASTVIQMMKDTDNTQGFTQYFEKWNCNTKWHNAMLPCENWAKTFGIAVPFSRAEGKMHQLPYYFDNPECDRNLYLSNVISTRLLIYICTSSPFKLMQSCSLSISFSWGYTLSNGQRVPNISIQSNLCNFCFIEWSSKYRSLYMCE